LNKLASIERHRLSSSQSLRMPSNVIDHERRDEIIAVVVLRLVAMRPQLAGTR